MKIPFPRSADRTYSIVLALGAALYAVTALTNQGIVAIDDYAFMTRRFLPAQGHTVAGIVAAEGFRSPVPLVVHYALARLALMLGLAHPLDQLRFNLLTLGLLGFGVMAAAGHTLFAGYEEAQRRRHRTVFALLLGFYFVAPVAFTRPMIESLAAPWVLASAAAAAVYFREGRRGWLVASVVAMAIAAMMRPQAGVVFLALPAVIALRRRWWDLVPLAVVALGVVIGFPLLTALALQYITSARSIVFIGLLPLATALFGVIRGGERPKPAFWLFSMIGAAAVAGFALANSSSGSMAGDLLMVAAILVCGLGYAEGAHLSRRLGGWQVISWALVLSLPLMLVLAILYWPSTFAGIGVPAWIGLAYVSLFSMLIGFVFWYRGLAQGGIAAVGQLQLLQPFFGLALAATLLREEVSPLMLVVTVAVAACVAGAKRFSR